MQVLYKHSYCKIKTTVTYTKVWSFIYARVSTVHYINGACTQGHFTLYTSKQ